jgi:hypothetical protein
MYLIFPKPRTATIVPTINNQIGVSVKIEATYLISYKSFKLAIYGGIL